MRTPMTADDYRASRPIVDPLRLFDCSPVGDGAVCVIVAAAGANAHAVRITGAQGMRAGRNEFIFAPSGLGMKQQSHTRHTHDEARNPRITAMAATSPEQLNELDTNEYGMSLRVNTNERSEKRSEGKKSGSKDKSEE